MEVRPSALNEVVIRAISHPIINETVITHCLLAGTCLSIKRPIMRTKFVAYLVPALGSWESAGGKSERKSAIILFLRAVHFFFGRALFFLGILCVALTPYSRCVSTTRLMT